MVNFRLITESREVKKMRTKKMLGLILGLLFLVPGVAIGDTLVLGTGWETDTSSGINSGQYHLAIYTDPSYTGYKAIFLADTNVVSGYKLDAFQIKLDTSAAGIIYSVIGPFTGIANAPGSVGILTNHPGLFPVDNFSGIYDAPTDAGIPLDGSLYKWTFYFTLTTALEPQAFQVLFNNAPTGNAKPRLSQSIPEPGILILLGIAMSAVGLASRYVRKI